MKSSGLATDQVVIGIDVGGSKIAAALVDPSGRMLMSRTVPTMVSSDEAILSQMEDIIEDVLKAKPKPLTVVGIGVGLPGVVDVVTGTAVYAANLPWKNTLIAPRLYNRFTLPTHINNDANAGALGEKWFGQGKTSENFVYLAIGTGIGSGIIINNRLLQGNMLTSPEAGHMIIVPDGPLCRCGTRGCLEVMAAGPAIARRAQQKEQANPEITAQMVIEAARLGDRKAILILEETAGYLAVGVINLWRLIAPELIILGGGVIQAGDLLLTPLRRAIYALAPNRDVVRAALVLSALKGASGVLGAAAIVLEKIAVGHESIPHNPDPSPLSNKAVNANG